MTRTSFDVRAAGKELHIPPHLIDRFDGQPREHFDEEDLTALGKSMKAIGQLIPIQVKQKGDRYQLVEGERRWRAAKAFGIPYLRATLEEVRNRDHHYVLSCVANVGREGYTPQELTTLIGELLANREVERLVTEEKRERLARESGGRRKGRRPSEKAEESDKVDWIARALGHSPAWVYQYLSLKRLDTEVFKNIKPVGDQRGLTFTTAKDLAASIPDDKPLQKRLAREIVEKEMSNREARGLIRRSKMASGYGLERTDAAGRKTRHSFAGRLLKATASSVERETGNLLDLQDAQIRAALREFNAGERREIETAVDAAMSRLARIRSLLRPA